MALEKKSTCIALSSFMGSTIKLAIRCCWWPNLLGFWHLLQMKLRVGAVRCTIRRHLQGIHMVQCANLISSLKSLLVNTDYNHYVSSGVNSSWNIWYRICKFFPRSRDLCGPGFQNTWKSNLYHWLLDPAKLERPQDKRTVKTKDTHEILEECIM